MHTEEILKKTKSGDVLSHEELVYLLNLVPDSAETYMVMAEATRLSKELSGERPKSMRSLLSTWHLVLVTVSSALLLT